MTRRQCPACASIATHVFAELRDLPVHVGVLWRSAQQAQACARGDVDLAFCRSCGYIWNIAFDPKRVDYTQDYSNSLAASPTYQAFDSDLAKSLVTRYNIRNATVAEIGSGDGRFLSLLCEFGDNRGIGFDPTAHGADRADGSVRVVSDFFHADDGAGDYSLVVCRQVLEHIPDPHELLREVRKACAPDTIVYFEVPNARLMLEQLSIWDCVYEHCSHFVVESLKHLFELEGFEVLDIHESYASQFLGVEARLAPGIHAEQPDIVALSRLVQCFADRLETRRDDWAKQVERWRAAHARIVVWGGGARGVSLLTMLGITDEVACVVDVNPNKQGTFLAGTGHRIEAPGILTDMQPDTVVVVNPIYMEEIKASLGQLGVRTEVVVA